MLCTFARLMRLERALRSVRRPECDRPATVSGSVRFSGESARKVIPLQATVVGSVIAWRHTDYLTEEHNSLCRSIFLGCMRCLHTVWVSSVKSYRGWRRSASSRS